MSNSKRGIAVDENGKLDDEVSVISSDVGFISVGNYYGLTVDSKIGNITKGGFLVRRKSLVRAGMRSKTTLKYCLSNLTIV